MATKPLLIISGKLKPNSILASEFGLTEIFSLRIGAASYRELIEDRVSDLGLAVEIQWEQTQTFEDLQKIDSPSRLIYLYDANQFLIDRDTLKKKLQDSDLKSTGLVNLEFRSEIFVDLSNENALISFLLLKSPHRDFNQLEIQDQFVVKRCSFETKGKREFTFLNNVPNEVKSYFPQVRGYQEGADWQQYEVELIRTFDFGRIAMHGKIELQVFKNFLSQLDQFLKKSPRVKVSARRFQQHLESLFVTKLESRFEELKETKVGMQLALENSLQYRVDHLVLLLKAQIQKIQDQELIVSHGDLCFSNILYGTRNHSLKFIDPRGINTPEEVFGPWYYDLAKLSHSIFGQYDLIINDVKRSEEPQFLFEQMQSEFKSWVLGHGWNFGFLRLCEASLFFSMLPFHLNRLDHAKLQIQSGMLALEAGQGQSL